MIRNAFLDASLSRRSFLQQVGVAGAGALAATGVQIGQAGAQETPERREGGTIVYHVRQEGSHLVPPFSSFSTVIEPTVAYFNGLTRPGPELEPEPDLAETWDVNADGTLYTSICGKG